MPAHITTTGDLASGNRSTPASRAPWEWKVISRTVLMSELVSPAFLTWSMLRAMKIKLTRCHLCHATKVRLSPTAYVYCDYCGALTDFDFQLAISDKRSKLPGPEYERISK